jgi:hypothetical protein
MAGASSAIAAAQSSATSPISDRAYLTRVLVRIAEPVLSALSQRKLKALMPVEAPHGNAAERGQYTHLEALGRLLAGMAPWLESGDDAGEEGRLRTRYCALARDAIAAAVDPHSPDFMNFNRGSQPLVDAALLALAVLRAPTQLWEKLPSPTRTQLIEALQSSRVIRPGFNNWLLFSATVEAFFAFANQQWDSMRVDYAVREHEQWYKGDGVYSDGPQFHWNYYNSYVIQPMLLTVIETVSRVSDAWNTMLPAVVTRARRYAGIQERLIGPDGSFPAIGRSISYRFGALHLLATMAWRRQLPDGITPEQVRGAITAVVRRMIEAPGTFDDHGWLRVGFCGHQPAVAEPYISTGSLYLCTAGLVPLGLPASDPFWSNSAKPWTSQKMWSGQAVPADHAI